VAHIVLLGDSTLDNAAYVPAGEDVTSQLRRLMPPDWCATLLALDGSVIAAIERQLPLVPDDATHLIVSVGGNDALGCAGVLDEPAGSIADALDRLATISERFRGDYARMLDAVAARNLPTAVATIYNAFFPDPALRRLSGTALAVLNDCIFREAAMRGLPLIDLRLIAERAEDYANPIEPSGPGGRKFAAAIAALVAEHDFARGRAGIFARTASPR
jgi:hypothetical protein